ncbi:zinc finger protein ZAT9-like [Cicer arietinum]|uniref:Zinc finger protein ZAT9-like n=1 Tax=Cicer arietinum TaxID=3827 RepID=A0A1S2YRT8_CICAR|nr:zinc finger protein ZAT9-like [Cicer arietinum]
MERHKCKLCSRTFGNGRALGGHMKAHLAIAKPKIPLITQSATSFSSFSSSESEQEQQQQEEKALVYVLRENPKMSYKIADPKFTESLIVVQDRESETESKNPLTRQRSKRNRKNNINNNDFQSKKPKMSGFIFSTPTPPFNEQEPVSSVSNTSPEEDVAMCLMMLSRDKWSRERNNINNVFEEQEQEQEESKVKRVRGKHLCENCGKTFRSSRALGSHKSVCCRNQDQVKNTNNGDKIFECPFCSKVFGSGQALGGHKRSHLISSSSNSNANNVNPSVSFKESFIDLNLPAPLEVEDDDDDLSVVSDA